MNGWKNMNARDDDQTVKCPHCSAVVKYLTYHDPEILMLLPDGRIESMYNNAVPYYKCPRCRHVLAQDSAEALAFLRNEGPRERSKGVDNNGI